MRDRATVQRTQAVEIERVYGGQKVGEAYKKIVEGKLGPDKGYIWSLWDSEDEVSDGGSGNERARM